MMLRRIFFLCSLLLFVLLFFSCSQRTIFIVRHAEKAASPAGDPPLTPEGMVRVQALVDSMRDKRLGFVFSTPTLRTQSTAAPVAAMAGKDMILYSSDTLCRFAERLKGLKENALVVGHSNTIPALLDCLALPHHQGSEIPSNVYDNLFEVQLRRNLSGLKVRLKEKKFGLPSLPPSGK